MESSFDWDATVESLGPKLYRYFAARFDDILADDLTQETLVRLVSKFNQGEYDNQKGSLDGRSSGSAVSRFFQTRLSEANVAASLLLGKPYYRRDVTSNYLERLALSRIF